LFDSIPLVHVVEAALPMVEHMLEASTLSVMASQQARRLAKLHAARAASNNTPAVVKIKEIGMLAHSDYEGFWHIEGVPDNNIVGVVLYYYRFYPELQVWFLCTITITRERLW
jgi:hypothetical protein